jgi:hypothetical protein
MISTYILNHWGFLGGLVAEDEKHGKIYRYIYILYLVGGLEPWNFMTFHSVGNVIIPTDVRSSIFQRGRLNHQPDINITGDSDISYPESNYLFAKIEEVNGKSTRKPYVWLTKWFQPQILARKSIESLCIQ